MNENKMNQVRPALRDFHLMVMGQIVTVMGSALLRFALSLYVLDLTGRVDIFATLFALSNIPLLFSPIGGAISDRFDRQRLMVLYDAACGFITFVFLGTMMAGNRSLILIAFVMLLLGVVGAMETPNGTACVPLVVPSDKLESANGVIQAVQSVSGVAAPVLGGVLYGVLGIQMLVGLSGVAFVLAAFVELFIQIPFVKRSQETGILQTLASDLKSGFLYVWQETFIRKMALLATLLNLILVPCFLVVCPFVLRVTMKGNDTVYGIGMGMIEGASILGALTVGIFTKNMRIQTMWHWILGSALLFVPLTIGVFIATISNAFYLPILLFLGSLVLLAVIATFLSIFAIVRIQKRTPNENIGKVMAIVMAIAQCAAPMGQFLYGEVLQIFNKAIYVPLLATGCLMLLVAFVGKNVFKKEELSG